MCVGGCRYWRDKRAFVNWARITRWWSKHNVLCWNRGMYALSWTRLWCIYAWYIYTHAFSYGNHLPTFPVQLASVGLCLNIYTNVIHVQMLYVYKCYMCSGWWSCVLWLEANQRFRKWKIYRYVSVHFVVHPVFHVHYAVALPAYYFNGHSGPVSCVDRSPFFRDILLTVGGCTWALWKEGAMVMVHEN